MQRARCRAHFSGARGGIGTGILGSRIFSHVRCLWELESSCSIFVLSLTSCLRSSGWATFCISLDHFCIIFSRSPLLLPGVFLTLRVSSSSNSSLVFRLNPGCLSKSLHASSFIFWKRSSSSARFPVVSTSPQLLTHLTRELLPHRSFIFPCCLDEEVECLVSQGCYHFGLGV